MQIKKELLKREIAGDVILVPVGQTVIENNGLFVLNELGGFLWDKLPEAENAEALTKSVLEVYDVDEATAKADIEEFLQQLQKLDII